MGIVILGQEEVNQRHLVNVRQVSDLAGDLYPLTAAEGREVLVDDALAVGVQDEADRGGMVKDAVAADPVLKGVPAAEVERLRCF